LSFAVPSVARAIREGRPSVCGREAQWISEQHHARLYPCEDTEIGRKYAADLNAGAGGATQAWINGYLNSFSSWSYAKDAFNKWAALTARRLAVLRGWFSAAPLCVHRVENER
jgi:hypothetical protein